MNSILRTELDNQLSKMDTTSWLLKPAFFTSYKVPGIRTTLVCPGYVSTSLFQTIRCEYSPSDQKNVLTHFALRPIEEDSKIPLPSDRACWCCQAHYCCPRFAIVTNNHDSILHAIRTIYELDAEFCFRFRAICEHFILTLCILSLILIVQITFATHAMSFFTKTSGRREDEGPVPDLKKDWEKL